MSQQSFFFGLSHKLKKNHFLKRMLRCPCSAKDKLKCWNIHISIAKRIQTSKFNFEINYICYSYVHVRVRKIFMYVKFP